MSNSAVDTALHGQYDDPVEDVKTRKIVQVTLSPDLYKLVTRVAREQERPVANLFYFALMRYLRDLGELPPETGASA